MGLLSSINKERKRALSSAAAEVKRGVKKFNDEVIVPVGIDPWSYLLNGKNTEDAFDDISTPISEGLPLQAEIAYQASPEGFKERQDARIEAWNPLNPSIIDGGQNSNQGGFRNTNRPDYSENNPFAKYANAAGFSDFADYEAPVSSMPAQGYDSGIQSGVQQGLSSALRRASGAGGKLRAGLASLSGGDSNGS